MKSFKAFNEEEGEFRGSANAEDRHNRGWVVGSAKYADEEPHHTRGQGGAWNYEQMHHAETERTLSMIIDGEYDGEKIDKKYEIDGVLTSLEFPKLSEDIEADEEVAKENGTVRTYLLRNGGNVVDPIQIPEEFVVGFHADEIEVLDDDTDEPYWRILCYSTEQERRP